MQLAIFCKYTFVCTVLSDLATKPILLIKKDMHVTIQMMQVWYNDIIDFFKITSGIVAN